MSCGDLSSFEEDSVFVFIGQIRQQLKTVKLISFEDDMISVLLPRLDILFYFDDYLSFLFDFMSFTVVFPFSLMMTLYQSEKQ